MLREEIILHLVEIVAVDVNAMTCTRALQGESVIGSLLSLKTPSEMTCPCILIAERDREREKVFGMGVVFLYRAPFIHLPLIYAVCLVYDQPNNISLVYW